MDGKPLPIGNHSHDNEVGYDRGAGGKTKGYKLHVIAGKHGETRAWCVRPIHHDEARVAVTLLSAARLHGYRLGDANYDRNALYEACRQRGVQLLAPRRFGPSRGLGHHWHSRGRLRAIEMLEVSTTGFASTLLLERRRPERLFGGLSSSAFGLPSLPPWVRGLRRVEGWMCAKLIVRNCAKHVRRSVA